jgi:putative membrane protein
VRLQEIVPQAPSLCVHADLHTMPSASKLANLTTIAVLAISLSACRRGNPDVVVQAAPAVGSLTDANIAAIVLAANNADILYGSLAAARSPNADIRRFAETTVRDHRSVNEAATALAGKLNLTPEEHTASLDLRDNAEDKRGQLRELEGTAFDKAYLENEVAYHTKLLATIDGTLIPSATNAELKALLIAVRPAVVAHLEHAKQLQAAISR